MNSRFSLLLDNYARFDVVTLSLAGAALVCVLTGWLVWAAHGRGVRIITPRMYLSVMAAGWAASLIGTLYLLLAHS